jgi:hypothetical protein
MRKKLGRLYDRVTASSNAEEIARFSWRKRENRVILACCRIFMPIKYTAVCSMMIRDIYKNLKQQFLPKFTQAPPLSFSKCRSPNLQFGNMITSYLLNADCQISQHILRPFHQIKIFPLYIPITCLFWIQYVHVCLCTVLYQNAWPSTSVIRSLRNRPTCNRYCLYNIYTLWYYWNHMAFLSNVHVSHDGTHACLLVYHSLKCSAMFRCYGYSQASTEVKYFREKRAGLWLCRIPAIPPGCRTRLHSAHISCTALR